MDNDLLREQKFHPWVMVFVYLMGLFTIKAPLKKNSLTAFTMIDPTNKWFEIFESYDKLANHIQDLFHKSLLACCLCPKLIVFDNLSIGKLKREFKQTSNYDGIIVKPTTQANAIIEHIYKLINDHLT
jgi:hypothetical protein